MGSSDKRPVGKTALVTGGSSGIGYCFCRELASRGCNLVIVSNQEEELTAVALDISKDFPVGVTTFYCDLAHEEAAQQVMRFLDEQKITVDILINNAGIFSFREVAETPVERINCFIDLHCRTVSLLCRMIGDDMRGRGHGRILNMSSMSCWMPMPGIALYSATKAYIRVFSRALHYELKDSGVTVTVACPGGIATDLFGLPENLKRLAVRIGALDTPESFSRKAVNRMLLGRKQYINGLLNRLSIFFVGIAPTPLRMLVKRKMLDKNINV